MNQEMEKAVIELIKGAVANAEQAKQFILSETPEFVQQLLLWKAMTSVLLCLIGVALAALAVWYRRNTKGLLEEAESESEKSNISFVRTLVLCGIVFLSVFVVFENMEWLQIWIAPKVYLVEYAASLAGVSK